MVFVYQNEKSVRSFLVAAAASFIAVIAFISESHAETLSPDAIWYAAYERDSHRVALPDGRMLNLYCMGSGSPTVVLEAGIGGGAYDWRSVQEAMSKQTRVCAYDRAGYGKSSPGPLPRDVKAETADLEALLKAAQVAGPYVLVGHSMGGYIVRMFANRHLSDVAGMVLVESSVENQLAPIENAAPAIAENDKRSEKYARYCGTPNPTVDIISDCNRAAPKDFPPELAAAWAEEHGTASMQAFSSEVLSFLSFDSDQAAAERRDFGAMPLIVLTRGNRSEGIPPDQAEAEWQIWSRLHGDLAKLSTASVHRVVPGAGHYIQIDRPDAVIDAVREVVTRAQNAAH